MGYLKWAYTEIFTFIHMIKLTCGFYSPSLDYIGHRALLFWTASSKASCSEARCHPSSASSSGGVSCHVSTNATRIGADFGRGSAHQCLQMFANTWI